MTSQEKLQQALDFAQNNIKGEYFGLFLLDNPGYNLSDADYVYICFPDKTDTLARLSFEGARSIQPVDGYVFFMGLEGGVLPCLETLFASSFIINPKYVALWDKILVLKYDIIKHTKDEIMTLAEHYCNNQLYSFVRNEGSKMPGAFYTVKPILRMLTVKEIVSKIAAGKRVDTLAVPEEAYSFERENPTYDEVEKMAFDTYSQILHITQPYLLMRRKKETDSWFVQINSIIHDIFALAYHKRAEE